MRKISDALVALLKVKSLMTLGLTAVFCYMCCAEKVTSEFMTIYAAIVSFYFGNQLKKDKVQD